MAEGFKLGQVDNLPEETVCNEDVDMTWYESLAIDNSASFRKLKDFPIVSICIITPS